MSIESKNPMAANDIYSNDRAHVIHSWSVQSKLNPLVVNKAEAFTFGTTPASVISTWHLSW